MAVVAGLAALGLATATFATGSRTALSGGAQPNHTKPKPPPTSTEPEPEPPPSTTAPPPPPPDPLANAVQTSLQELQLTKTDARADLRINIKAMGVFCLYAYGEPGVVNYYYGGTYAQLCQTFIYIVLGELKIAQDPPDPKFMEVTLPAATLARSITIRCPKRVARRDCEALKAATLRYRNALATTAAAATGSGITLERYSGAAQAGSAPGAVLQAAAEKAYAGELASALAAQQAAGGTLAAVLRKTRLDVRLNARDLQSVTKKLGSPNGLPQSFVSQLVAAGLTSGAAELSQTLKSALQGLPKTLVPSSTLGGTRSTAALTQLYRTLTFPELAALVRGLTDQGGVSTAARDTLINDLRQGVTAPTPEARTPAVDQFVKDAGSQVTGPAATLLMVAGAALTG